MAGHSPPRRHRKPTQTEANRSHGTPVRLLVVDDHPVVRFGIVNTLRTQEDFDVVGEAETCAEASEKVASLKPDVVILDLELDDASGTEALARLRRCDPKVPVVVYSAYQDEIRLAELVQGGVQGYLQKRSTLDALFEAIRVVANGGTFYDPASALQMMRYATETGRGANVGGPELTERERSVLVLLAQGKRNKQISKELFISEYTVKFHVSTLLTKLDAANRTEAVRIAAARGLVHI